MEVIQQATALADHFEQAAPGTMVLNIGAEMLRQVVDSLRQ